jgi:2-oxo-4-hydroxy-4-carboxy--5-ureidoimidazoline (OHCU) decarboxylase
VRELPRQLTAEQLAELFEGRTRFVERLAAVEDPLGQARDVARELADDEKKEVLDAHPAIGGRAGSVRSTREQGTDGDPQVLAELAELNRAYEERFGFRFVVFVNRRPRREIVPILRERLRRTRAEELETGVDELVQIALDRWNAGRWRTS